MHIKDAISRIEAYNGKVETTSPRATFFNMPMCKKLTVYHYFNGKVEGFGSGFHFFDDLYDAIKFTMKNSRYDYPNDFKIAANTFGVQKKKRKNTITRMAEFAIYKNEIPVFQYKPRQDIGLILAYIESESALPILLDYLQDNFPELHYLRVQMSR